VTLVRTWRRAIDAESGAGIKIRHSRLNQLAELERRPPELAEPRSVRGRFGPIRRIRDFHRCCVAVRNRCGVPMVTGVELVPSRFASELLQAGLRPGAAAVVLPTPGRAGVEEVLTSEIRFRDRRPRLMYASRQDIRNARDPSSFRRLCHGAQAVLRLVDGGIEHGESTAALTPTPAVLSSGEITGGY